MEGSFPSVTGLLKMRKKICAHSPNKYIPKKWEKIFFGLWWHTDSWLEKKRQKDGKKAYSTPFSILNLWCIGRLHWISLKIVKNPHYVKKKKINNNNKTTPNKQTNIKKPNKPTHQYLKHWSVTGKSKERLKYCYALKMSLHNLNLMQQGS